MKKLSVCKEMTNKRCVRIHRGRAVNVRTTAWLIAALCLVGSVTAVWAQEGPPGGPGAPPDGPPPDGPGGPPSESGGPRSKQGRPGGGGPSQRPPGGGSRAYKLSGAYTLNGGTASLAGITNGVSRLNVGSLPKPLSVVYVLSGNVTFGTANVA